MEAQNAFICINIKVVTLHRRSVLLGMSSSYLLMTAPAVLAGRSASDLPATVSFPSLDGRTTLVGYLFKPRSNRSGKSPAIVLLHGRAGPYSSLANGNYSAATLSKRHMMWGEFWSQRGGLALLVDSFGPRGFAKGFAAGAYDERPPEVNEVTVRPLDAYGALQFLTSVKDSVDAMRIGLQGWSNGGSAVLATMAKSTLSSLGLSESVAFRAALAFYPGCGLDDKFRGGYTPYAPVRIFIGTADEEVSPQKCETLAQESRNSGNNIEINVYPDATHDFDDPGVKRQSVPANVAATADATAKAASFMGQYLGV
jgi:dienelactone hydrolase